MPRKQKQRWPARVYEIERKGLALDWSDSRIHQEIVSELKKLDEQAPNPRTVQRHMAELRVDDSSGRWSFTDETVSGIEARVVFDYLRDYIESQGMGESYPSITKAQARWMAKLNLAAPGLSSFVVMQLAREYIRRSASEVGTDDLDTWLAFRPWEDEQRKQRYEEAIRLGWIPYTIDSKGAYAVGADWFHQIETTNYDGFTLGKAGS